MRRYSTNENQSAIPPNLLKNFNVYDILEPQKSSANSVVPKVDKLIDIDDCSRDSGFQDSEFTPSLLDKNRDFDLVDLYQNIFVTPQHLKKKETVSNEGAKKELDIDFKRFFDMLKSGKKVDWENLSEPEMKAVLKHDYLDRKPRVLVPKVVTESDSDTEDLINEVLAQKSIEKRILDEIKNKQKHNVDFSKKIKNADAFPECSRTNMNNSFTKDSKFESGSNENEPSSSDFKSHSINSQINNSLTTFTVKAIQKDEKVYKKKRIVKPELQKANYTKGPDFYEKSVVLPQIMARLEARHTYLDEKSNYKKRLVLDTGSKSAECSPKIEKPKTKPESSGLKSVPTQQLPKQRDPQLCISKLTQSIAVHATDKCQNCTKVTTVNANSPLKTDGEFGKVSPTVLMEDCNKERLRALIQSQMFKDFVLNGKY